MIKLSNVSKSYENKKIVKNINLEIKEGEIFGFLGPNGAGKTTTIKMIVGLSQPTSGAISINNRSMNNVKSRETIGFMPEDPYFYDHLTAREFLSFMKDLFPRSTQDIDQLLKLVGLHQKGDVKISAFSKGMKQRLGLAQALVNDPQYLFLDEPLDGLDPIGRREFKKILLALKKNGKTIFFNSHVLSDVEEICDKIGIINDGKLIYSGSIKKFAGNKSLEDAFVEKISVTN